MKYIDAEKLFAEIEKMRKINRKALEAGHIGQDVFHGRAQTLNYLFEFIDSLQQEQPNNEDVDKVAQELYEHLYELKRRNNVPTNLYDKQEIIDLWKAGIVYGRSHPKQEQPEVDLEEAAMNYIAPIENEDGLKVINFSGRDLKDAFIAGAEWQKEQMEASTPVLGEVHHVLNCHYIETDSKQLGARLRIFPEGAKVEIYIKARKVDGE